MRGKLALVGSFAWVMLMAFAPVANALLSNKTTVAITDLSWPNCTNSSVGHAAVGIVGVNGGLDFHPNPCVYSESKLFGSYALYLNTGYPGASYAEKYSSFPLSCAATDWLCLAYNYGYNAARYSVTYASQQSVHAFMWWLDVENSNSWTDNSAQNRAALTGMINALQHYTFLPTIGFYSYPGQWNDITQHWQNGFPVWVATGTASPHVAESFCRNENFTGGNTWLSQYTLGLDQDDICSSSFSQHLMP